MTKRDKLDILMLLSAIESWGFTSDKLMPDYLHDGLTDAVKMLKDEVLEDKTEGHPAMQSDRGDWAKHHHNITEEL